MKTENQRIMVLKNLSFNSQEALLARLRACQGMVSASQVAEDKGILIKFLQPRISCDN